MQNLKIKLNSESEAEEVKRLAVKAGYTLDALFGKKWTAEFCYLVLCENMSAGFANEIMADGDKPLSIGELWAMANPMKEYLDENRNYKFLISTEKDDGFIEIPEGAEAFGYTGIVHTFYKNDFRSFFNENTDGQWDERSETWIGRKDPVILWQRATHPEELPFIDDEPKYTDDEVKYMDENGQGRLQSLNDQYAEIEKVRQHNHYFKDVSGLNEIDVYMVLKIFNVTDPCLQHIAKKALCAGQRGHKDFKKDLQDILDTAKRAVEINK